MSTKGYRHTEATRVKMAAAARASAQRRIERRAQRGGAWHTAEGRARIGTAAREARLREWADPVMRERRTAAIRASWTPERRARHSAITRAAIAEHRARRESGEAA